MAFSWNRDSAVSLSSDAAPTTVSASGGAEQTVGSLLEELLQYFTVNLPLFPQLVPAAQAMTPAIKAYGTGSTQDPYGPVRQVVAQITAAQQSDAEIPSP